MKLKEMIIESEYNDAFYPDAEYTDWINCMEYDYTETGSSLKVTTKTNVILNTDIYSPYSTVNS